MPQPLFPHRLGMATMAMGLDMVEPVVEASSWPNVVVANVNELNSGFP